MLSLSFLLYSIHLGFSLTGIAVITYGVGRSFFIFLKNILFPQKETCLFEHARLILCQSIIFGLEFMVASDVVRTMAAPDFTNIIILGGLVIIRTILSYFLTQEMEQLTSSHKSAKCTL